MTVGEFYAWNGNIGSDNCLYYETLEYLGADKWKVSFMGVSLTYKGDFIYDNFYKVSG